MKPHLQKLKIGCVKYLNSVPLICDYEGSVHFDHPSRLAALLEAGELDVGLVPVFELFRHPDYKVTDGVAIASRGEVFSVFLAYHGDLDGVAEIALDAASLTSANLLRCLLAEYYGRRPRFVGPERFTDPDLPRLLIGNQAIDFRRTNGPAWNYLDLGEEWTRRTGLPFVYALWLIHPRVENAAEVAVELRRLKQTGLERLPEICRVDSEFRLNYLQHCIRYELGAPEKKGMQRFGELLHRHRLIEAPVRGFEFV